jgi:type IV secretory pathway TrbD component
MDQHRHIPTIYSDPRTIYTQPPDLYDPPDRPRPRPASPAVSVQPEPTPTVAPPTTPKVWQRQHRQSLATRTSQAAAPAMPTMLPPRGSVADVDIGNRVHQSLQRPKLLRGGEWQLSLMTNLIAAGFVILAIMQWNWRFLPGALVFGGLIQWVLRVLANHDPKRWQKYMCTHNQPLVREPHGKPGDTAPAPRILPKPSLFIH